MIKRGEKNVVYKCFQTWVICGIVTPKDLARSPNPPALLLMERDSRWERCMISEG